MKLWPKVPNYAYINGMADVVIYEDSELEHKPVLRLVFKDVNGKEVTIYASANTMEMVGGAATGARKRWEDFNQ
jgi:hypothetical protein